MAIKSTTSTDTATARSNYTTPPPPLPNHPCQTCGAICQQRCQQCRRTYYCSTTCQKKDWKKHRLVCSDTQNKNQQQLQLTPLEAWKELCQMVTSSTTDEANQRFHQARDEVIKLQIEKEKEEEKVKLEQRSLPSRTVRSEEPPDHSEPNNLPHYQGSLAYTIEKMPNLFMYQVVVHIPKAQQFHLKSCKIQIVLGNILSVQLSPNEPLLQLHLPNKNMSIVGNPRLVDLVQEHHRGLYVRLVDADQNMDPISMDSNHRLLLQSRDASRLSCRSCGQQLFEKNSIQNAVLMPSSRWEDMADYLTCLDPTNTAVESLASPTTTGSGKPHHMLQDTTTFVVHVDDVIDSSVCVLAVPGYGQEDTMEDSTMQNTTWMQNSIGATLTCSRCADILGEASAVDTFRLFHHKLCLVHGNDDDDDDDKVAFLSTLSSFLATELVRHAETHAVYSFGVVNQAQPHRLLHIQLVSWESEVAYSHESFVNAQNVHQLEWRKVAKVLFYETTANAVEESSSPSLLWQTDWCCDPMNGVSPAVPMPNTATNNNTIKLYLSSSEWTSLKDELMELSQKQVREIADATIMAKTGNAASKEMHLATLFRN